MRMGVTKLGEKADLDETLQLDAVYYSAPMPRTLSALVAMGLVFDRVHFPGVYLPQGDYDRVGWKAEAKRIADLNMKDFDTFLLVQMMSFTETAERLAGFLCYDKGRDDPLDAYDVDGKLVGQMQEALLGPPRDDFIPLIQTWHHKAVQGSKEHLTYRGDIHYHAGALRAASDAGIPLICDVPGLPIPGAERAATADAKALSAFIALQAMHLVLPEMPLLRPDDLMEFRQENAPHLRAFRRAMLRYAGAWRGQLAVAAPEEIAQETRFLVETEIVPALDELRQLATDPARPWLKRAIDGVRLTASVAGSCFTMRWDQAAVKVLGALAPQFLNEIDAKGDKRRELRRSDLYYLLQVQKAAKH